MDISTSSRLGSVTKLLPKFYPLLPLQPPNDSNRLHTPLLSVSESNCGAEVDPAVKSGHSPDPTYRTDLKKKKNKVHAEVRGITSAHLKEDSRQEGLGRDSGGFPLGQIDKESVRAGELKCCSAAQRRSRSANVSHFFLFPFELDAGFFLGREGSSRDVAGSSSCFMQIRVSSSASSPGKHSGKCQSNNQGLAETRTGNVYEPGWRPPGGAKGTFNKHARRK